MMPEPLTQQERSFLLEVARKSIESAVYGKPPGRIDLSQVTDVLRQEGVAFVTLTKDGDLRGCVGALEAYQPLVNDVQEHAAAAAVSDFRFYPVQPGEVGGIHIEISRLTPPVPLQYNCPQDLPGKLTPHVDGVLIRDGIHRATFLPQVWDTLPEPEDFLNHLCQKMGAPANLWRKKMLQVSIYRVEMFEEVEAGAGAGTP